MNYLPSKRTALKFGRGILFAAIASGVAFGSDHLADLGLPPTAYAALVPIVAFVYRWARGINGQEPV